MNAAPDAPEAPLRLPSRGQHRGPAFDLHFEMKTSSASADGTTIMNLYPGKEDTMTTKLLAWCQYPEPHGTAYSDQDFADQRKVVEVLDRAQVLRAYITAEGWQKLWQLYGLRGLLDLNRSGGWFDTRDDAAAVEQIVHRSSVAGCDPFESESRELSLSV